MKIDRKLISFLFVISISFLNPLLVRAEEKSEALKKDTAEAVKEAEARPISAVVSGVNEVGQAPVKLVENVAEETKSGPPIVGTIKGIEKGAGDLTRTAVRSVSNIVTLGHGQQSELEPAEAGTNEPAKFKIRIPGS